MRKDLRALICTCLFSIGLLSAAHAQVKGNPQLKKAAPLSAPKSAKASRLNGDLQNLYDRVSGSRAKAPSPGDSLYKFMQIQGDKITVDITVKGDMAKTQAELEKKGLKVTGVYGRMISGMIPVKLLPQLETMASVRFVQPVYNTIHRATPRINAGQPSKVAAASPVISQGDSAQRSHIARQKYGVNGDGVKIGILSNSYNNLGTAGDGVAAGELPGAGNPFGFTKPVQVLQDGLSGGTDEGRGMAEIVHDVAPGAELAFNTANGGQAAFALSILKLADRGCNIITDDLFYLAEPFFQDGVVAQAVDKVKSQGVTYFSAAGNSSVRSYESNYRKSNFEPFGTGLGTAHNFSAAGDEPRYFQPVYIPANSTFIASFQWDEPFYSAGGLGSRSDLDIALLDTGGNIVAYAFADNIGSGDPIELFGYFNDTESETYFLSILKYDGPDPKRLKYILYGSGAFYLTSPAIPGILAPTIVGHAKAEGAIAVAAAAWFETPVYGVDTALVEPFSSLGGVANYFDVDGNRIGKVVRRKPEITAPDGGNTSFFPPAELFGNQDIPQDRDTFPNFFGTSAAAPHAAGVAALMIEAQQLKTLTPDQIKGYMMIHTKDMDNPYTAGFDKGVDFCTGGGLIRADALVNKVRYPNVYVVDLRLKPLCSDDPSATRRWQVYNPNPYAVNFTWYVVGTAQYGTLTARPLNTTTFSTNTIAGSNIVLVSWQDNFGIPRFDAETSSTDNCNSTVLAEIKSRGGDAALKDQPATGLNKAQVYPNPSTGNFKLLLATANPANTDIELYGADGRLLFKRKANTNGTHEINTAGYKPGIYLLRIRQDGFTKTIRLVKQ